MSSGVDPRIVVGALTSAPAAMSVSAVCRSPTMAAAWSAVRPSPRVAVAGAPVLSNCWTVAVSPRRTALTSVASLSGDASRVVIASDRTSAAEQLLKIRLAISVNSLRPVPKDPACTPRAGLRRVEIERRPAVAERLLLDAELLKHRQPDVRHWRLVRHRDMDIPFNGAVGVSRQEQRQSPMVVQIRIPHRRSVDDQALVEQIRVALLDALQL